VRCSQEKGEEEKGEGRGFAEKVCWWVMGNG